MTDESRDLAHVDLWEESLARSRRRREARERHLSFGPVDSKRIAVPAALLAGGTAVAGVASTGGGGGGGDATAASPTTAAATVEAEPVAAKAPARKKRPAPKKKAASADKRSDAAGKRGDAKPKPKPKKPVVVASWREAYSIGGFKRGMRGQGVIQLQRAVGVVPDGIYGPTTARAVRVAQKRHGVHVDGIVGPSTWQAISSPRSSSSSKARPAVHRTSKKKPSRSSTTTVAKVTVARTKRGNEVEALQAKLGLPVDGDFGAKTLAAVKRFQRRNGLEADGVVGPSTWRALGLSPNNRTVHPHNFGRKRRGGGGRASSGGGSSSWADRKVAQMVAAGNRIATKPYRYGGGHGSFEDSGYDCSGSVSYVLHGAGLLDSPLDSSSFMSWGKPGPGKRVTIYANPGHMFMVIDGRRFDTGYGGQGNRWASGSRPTAGYTVRHPPGL